MYVGPVWNDIANVDADTKSDRSVGGHLSANDRDLLLYSKRTSHGAIDAVEYHEQRSRAGIFL